jgi:iron complex outermembrane receptor protein
MNSRSAITYVLVGLLIVGANSGMTAEEPSGSTPSAAIAAQPLSRALAAFSAQTGLQLVYVSSLVDGHESQNVPAGLTPRAALARLLGGTGLDFVFLNARTVKIFAAPPATSTTVAPARARDRETVLPAAIPAAEVVVTATKREQPLNDVPMSVSVLSSQEMQELNVETISDIATLTPGVEYDFSSQWGSGILTNLAIRGVNSNVGTSTTGVYVNDTPIQARNGFFSNPYPVTFDLARVEILRGPQGTLFGASAEGGAIRYITNEPSTTTFDGQFRSEAALTQTGAPSFEAGVAATGPIVRDSLGIRVSGWYRDDGGYVNRVDPLTNTTVDSDANNVSRKAFHIALAWEPGESTRITPSIEYESAQTHDTPNFYTYLSQPDEGILENGKLLPQPAEDGFTLASVTYEQRLGALKLDAITSYFDRSASATVDTTNVVGIVYFGGFGNPLGPAYPTSYADAVPTLLSLHQTLLSQEVRIASENPTGRLKWVGGLFYSRARQGDIRNTYANGDPANQGLYTNYNQTDELGAAFGNLDVALSTRWTASLGARVDHIRSDFTAHSGGFAYPSLPPLTEAVTTETPFTPRFSLSYIPVEHTLLYTTIAKGFRIGGINVGIPTNCGVNVPMSYASDSLWSEEIGVKDELLNGQLQLAASAFQIDWNRIQEHVVYDCGFGYTTNAGAATSRGFDLALDGHVTDRIQAGLALGSTDVYYTKTVTTASGQVVVDRGTVVGGVPSVPAPWIGTVFAQYQWPVHGGAFSGYVRAEDVVHSHNPGPFTEHDPRSIGYALLLRADPAINQLNLQVGLRTAALEIKLTLDNALNSQPLLQRFADSAGSSLQYAYTLRPRTLGLTVNRML